MKKNPPERDSHNDPEDPTPPTLPIANGGINPVAVAAMSQGVPPEQTEENFVCMKGPCKHYWHIVTSFDCGNPDDTWDHLGIEAPRQHHRYCLVNPGYETDLGEQLVFSCNKHQPIQIEKK